MKPSVDYRLSKLKRLKNKKEAEAYLNEALCDEDPRVFYLAIRDVAEAQGNMSELAQKINIHRTSLYAMTSKRGNPSFANIMKLLKELHINITLKAETGRMRFKSAH